jgi:hypothetical protein
METNDSKEKTLSWDQVEDSVTEKDTGGAAMAVIETEKIFSAVLKKLKLPGKDTDQRINSAKKLISNMQSLTLARSVHKKIATEVGAEIEVSDLQEILTAYHEAIRDLTKAQEKKFTTKERFIMFFRHYIPNPTKTLRNALIGLVTFFFIVFVLDSTSIGQAVVSAFTATASFIFSWVLFTVLLIIGVVIIIIGGILYFESRRKKKRFRAER